MEQQTIRRQPREKRWMPAHFPIGTIVEADLPHHGQQSKSERHVVVSTHRNGPRSFTIRTGVWDKDLEIMKGFNMSWVTRIIAVGHGGPSFQHRPPRKDVYDSMRLKDRLDMISQIQEDGYSPNTRNSHVHFSGREIGQLLINEGIKRLADTEILDYDLVVSELCKQSFFRRYPCYGDQHGMEISVVSKKKAKAWFNRNFRRFLANTRVVERQDEAETYRIMMEDLDEDLDRRYLAASMIRAGSGAADDESDSSPSVDTGQFSKRKDDEPVHRDDDAAGDERFALAP